MITQILLTQTFIMFILMILGLILSKTGLLTEHGSKDMANILLYAVIPCVIIRSYITDFTMEKLYGLLMSAVLAVAAFAVAIAVSYIIYGMRKPIDNFGTAFCNAKDLIEAVESGKIGSVGTDCCEGEDEFIRTDRKYDDLVVNHDYIILKSFQNTIVTPHVAFFTDQAVSDMVESSVKSVVQFAAGEDTPLEVH